MRKNVLLCKVGKIGKWQTTRSQPPVSRAVLWRMIGSIDGVTCDASWQRDCVTSSHEGQYLQHSAAVTDIPTVLESTHGLNLA